MLSLWLHLEIDSYTKRGHKMDKLQLLYEEAVQHTKDKIKADINQFMEKKESCPSIEEYLSERGHYVEQIWVNVWLNKVTNDVSRSDKKSFLREKDYEVEGVDRKLINRLFRNEMRDYRPFPVHKWLEESIAPFKDEWEKTYRTARDTFFQREEKEKREEAKRMIQKELFQIINQFLEVKHDVGYIHLRHYISKKFMNDLQNKPKYQRIEPFMIEEELEDQGSFHHQDYSVLADFLRELTGSIHKKLDYTRGYWEYETYFYTYERLVSNYISTLIPELILQEITSKILRQYKEVIGNKLTVRELQVIFAEQLLSLNRSYFEMIEKEYVEDLIKLSSIPFDEHHHLEIYKMDLINRERRKAEELLELQRKKEEEARMLEDIFGREYSPSLGKNIRYVLHIGETNTGKTHHALTKMKEAESGLYLAPLRLLALEVFDKLNGEGISCNLKTGEEEKEVPNARHISSTVEMFYEKEHFDVIIIDEAQMIADKDRGFSWYKAITKANANEVHIIGSNNVKPMLLGLLGEADIEIHDYSRELPLEVESKEFSIKHAKKGDAIVCFSRRKVLETASILQNNGHNVSMIYGSMPPETRKRQMQQFINGKTSMIVATDAIGMGLNLPIRRIVFLENEKFDGTRRRTLSSQEVKQIAGRAGRKGIYNIGKVAFTRDIKRMRKLLQQEDEPVQFFAIAPTNHVFERFQRYSHNLGDFFELWDKFESPFGTKKASLIEERELYELVADTEIEARLSMMDLYGFLHLPFSKKEPELTRQWLDTLESLIKDEELPEPIIKNKNLEQQEVSYKAVGLHLLFLYRIGRKTEAIYWERLREDIANGVHESLSTEVSSISRSCKKCGRRLPPGFRFPICDSCHYSRLRKKTQRRFD